MKAEPASRGQFLSFRLAGGDYAVGILQVKEILQHEGLTRIPSVPSSIRGVINLRGAVVPVIDLAVKLGLPPTGITGQTCILIVEASVGGRGIVVGVLADAVREVLELGAEEIESPPVFGAGVRLDFLVGLGRAGRGFVLVLDLDRVVAIGERELAAALREDAEGQDASRVG
jgi:purine-binding chemotaxis protein CheW